MTIALFLTLVTKNCISPFKFKNQSFTICQIRTNLFLSILTSISLLIKQISIKSSLFIFNITVSQIKIMPLYILFSNTYKVSTQLNIHNLLFACFTTFILFRHLPFFSTYHLLLLIPLYVSYVIALEANALIYYLFNHTLGLFMCNYKEKICKYCIQNYCIKLYIEFIDEH